jgi:protein ImuB
MYACLYAGGVPLCAITTLAGRFSPVVEQRPDAVVFSLTGLGRLIGGPRQIAAEIARQAESAGIRGQLAIAANPDTAELAARNLGGMTIVEPGREAETLAPVEIAALAQVMPVNPETLATLGHWGVRTLGDLAALPGLGLIERLGEEGERMRRLALGQPARPLDAVPAAADFTARAETEHAVESLEPLLFLVNGLVRDVMARLASQGWAANQITLTLGGPACPEQTRKLEFPVPVTDAAVILKQVQLDLEARAVGAPVQKVTAELRPAERRARQGGLYTPPVPEPEKLHTLLARIGALVGAGNAGSPELIDTHRPDAWTMRRFAPEASQGVEELATPVKLALRRMRPVTPARVVLEKERPQRMEAACARGRVLAAAGPWRSSGDWWGDLSWSREEWDIELSDGGLYRIYRAWGHWYVEGVYD